MKNVNIMIVGVGGQGTLLTSRIIGNTAISLGYEVKVSEVHGMAQRGGSVVTYVRFGEKVYEPVVDEGNVDFLIAFEKLEALRYSHYLSKDGVIIVNESQIDPVPVTVGLDKYPENIIETLQKNHKVYTINAENICKELNNKKVLNSVVLGLSAKVIGFSKEEWIKNLSSTVPPKTIELNVKAFEKGYEIEVK